MHEKYAGKGLAVMSVSVDPAGEKVARAKAERFLVKQRATFPNLLLDEDAEFWSDKLGFGAPPGVFVFDRRGKWTRFVPAEDAPLDYDAVEKLVVELLAEP